MMLSWTCAACSYGDWGEVLARVCPYCGGKVNVIEKVGVVPLEYSDHG